MQDLSKVTVVLVNTSHPGNIGASARAMKNMGLSRLALVQPKDFPSGVAAGRAASAARPGCATGGGSRGTAPRSFPSAPRPG